MLVIKDFLFESVIHINITLYVYLINIKMHKVFAKNDIDRIMKIFKKIRFDIISELDYENVFFVEQLL